jgi:hypothetical protein
MTADTAVNLMLEHEILPNSLIPAEACPYIAKALERMWQVGYEANTLSRTHELPIERHSPDGKVVTYPSLVIAARAHGVDKSTISKAAKGKIKTAAGFVWRYAEVG